MKGLALALLLFGLISCSKPSDKFYMPAEWEPHDAVWLGWEDDFVAYHPVAIDIIKSLTPHVKVKMTVSSDSLREVAKSLLSANGVDSISIEFITMPGNEYWIRDHGAAFLVNQKGELGVADFNWNNYGRPGWIKEKYDNNPDSTHKYYTLRLPKMNLTAKVDS